MNDYLAYPADMSWMLPTAAVVAAVAVVGLLLLRTVVGRRRRRVRAQGKEAVRRLEARARYERHEESKARVRFIPSDDTTDTR